MKGEKCESFDVVTIERALMYTSTIIKDGGMLSIVVRNFCAFVRTPRGYELINFFKMRNSFTRGLALLVIQANPDTVLTDDQISAACEFLFDKLDKDYRWIA